MKILNKIDLHLHIDGSVKPETVYELSRKYDTEPECNLTLEESKNSQSFRWEFLQFYLHFKYKFLSTASCFFPKNQLSTGKCSSIFKVQIFTNSISYTYTSIIIVFKV